MRIPKRVNAALDTVGGPIGWVRIITFLILTDATLAAGLAVKVSVAAVAWSLMALAAFAAVVWSRTGEINRLRARSDEQEREIGKLRHQNTLLRLGQIVDAAQLTAKLPHIPGEEL